MMVKKKILIITNVTTEGNPALWYLYKLLKDDYDIFISGNQKRVRFKEKGINYAVHSYCYSFFLLARFEMILKFILTTFFIFNNVKAQCYYKIILHKIRLHLNRFEFLLKAKKGFEFIINIDTEAAYISYTLSKKNKIPNAYFIYEFYAEQFIETKDEYYTYRTNLEKEMVLNSNVLISSTNNIIGEFLLQKFTLDKTILNFSVCHKKTFQKEITCNAPLKIYYHGALYDNRGIQEAILAMKEVEGAIFFIRGYGYLENVLKQIVLENKLTTKVIFLDPVPTEMLSKVGVEFDLGISLVRMNVLNHQYATGFKTFENISAGLALILPESFPLKQLNEDYKVGVTYKDATVENLVKLFQHCVNHPEKVLEWKQNSRKAYELEYNPEMQKKRLIIMIESLTNQ